MGLMTKIAKALIVIAVTFAWLMIIAALYPEVGKYVAALVVVLGLVTLLKPVSRIWIESRITSAVLVLIGALAFQVASHAIEQDRNTRKEARLQELRRSDTGAYLEELRATDPSRWEAEYEVLDKVGYDQFVRERRAKQAAETKLAISNVKSKLKTIPATDIAGQYAIYVELSELDPESKEYKAMRAKLLEVKLRHDEQSRSPEQFVKIEKFSWSIEGFGNVMIASFTIQNSLPWPVKDIEVRCVHSAPSGTIIDTNTRTIYERIEPSQSKRVTKFNMGFIHTQAARSGCQVRRVVVLR